MADSVAPSAPLPIRRDTRKPLSVPPVDTDQIVSTYATQSATKAKLQSGGFTNWSAAVAPHFSKLLLL
jgi:hypothetical protein